MIRKCRGQGTIEYVILTIIIIGALIASQQYIKRSFQGRWKSTMDDFGDQYDPAAVNSLINYSLVSQSNTTVSAVPSVDLSGQQGFVTNRQDITNSVETKQGYIVVAPP